MHYNMAGRTSNMDDVLDVSITYLILILIVIIQFVLHEQFLGYFCETHVMSDILIMEFHILDVQKEKMYSHCGSFCVCNVLVITLTSHHL